MLKGNVFGKYKYGWIKSDKEHYCIWNENASKASKYKITEVLTHAKGKDTLISIIVCYMCEIVVLI